MGFTRRTRALMTVTTATCLICWTLLLFRQANKDAVLMTIQTGNSLPPDRENWKVVSATPKSDRSRDMADVGHNSVSSPSLPSEYGTSMQTTVTGTNKEDQRSSNNTTTSASASPLDKMKVPFPIFVASLPKSGTTSIARYFYCGKIWTAHTFVNTQDGKQLRLGECFQQNMDRGKPPLDNCGRYHVYSDAGFIRGDRCFYPSVHGLQAFYDAYPTATILLVKRDSKAWLNSIKKWKGGALLKKWAGTCDQFPAKKATDDEMEQFYEWHAANIRTFADDHPSLTYVEFNLESTGVDQQLQETIGVNASCWGHHNSHEKRVRLNPKFRQSLNQTSLTAGTIVS
jgi:hypothetical protein